MLTTTPPKTDCTRCLGDCFCLSLTTDSEKTRLIAQLSATIKPDNIIQLRALAVFSLLLGGWPVIIGLTEDFLRFCQSISEYGGDFSEHYYCVDPSITGSVTAAFVVALFTVTPWIIHNLYATPDAIRYRRAWYLLDLILGTLASLFVPVLAEQGLHVLQKISAFSFLLDLDVRLFSLLPLIIMSIATATTFSYLFIEIAALWQLTTPLRASLNTAENVYHKVRVALALATHQGLENFRTTLTNELDFSSFKTGMSAAANRIIEEYMPRTQGLRAVLCRPRILMIALFCLPIIFCNIVGNVLLTNQSMDILLNQPRVDNPVNCSLVPSDTVIDFSPWHPETSPNAAWGITNFIMNAFFFFGALFLATLRADHFRPKIVDGLIYTVSYSLGLILSIPNILTSGNLPAALTILLLGNFINLYFVRAGLKETKDVFTSQCCRRTSDDEDEESEEQVSLSTASILCKVGIRFREQIRHETERHEKANRNPDTFGLEGYTSYTS